MRRRLMCVVFLLFGDVLFGDMLGGMFLFVVLFVDLLFGIVLRYVSCFCLEGVT